MGTGLAGRLGAVDRGVLQLFSQGDDRYKEIMPTREQTQPLYVPLADELLGSMTEAVYAVDRDRRIMYWNTAAAELTGYSAAEVVGRRCQDNLLNHVDEAGRQLCGGACPLLATVQDGRTREALVFLQHRDGHRLPVAVRAAALRSADENHWCR